MKWRFWKKEKQYTYGWISNINFSKKNGSFTVVIPPPKGKVNHSVGKINGKRPKHFSINGKKVK